MAQSTAAATARKRPGILVLVAGLLVMALAFAGVVFIGAASRGNGPALAKVTIVDAARDVKTGHAITADDLSMIGVDIVPTGAIKTNQDAIGKIARQDLKAGLPILDSSLAVPAAASAGKLYFALPSGAVAMNIPPTDISPYVQPGDQIDILAAPRSSAASAAAGTKTKIALKAIRVLAVGTPGTPSAGNLVVAVSPSQAEAIAYLVKNADFSYVLRSPLDANSPEQPTQGVDATTFKAQYGY